MKMQYAKCKGCGATIIWALNPVTGKTVPIDPKPPIYRVIEVNAKVECIREEVESPDILGVSHFATCSKANQFSGGGRQG
jgi:hypothetical protein